MRSREFSGALQEMEETLRKFPTTGRLWSVRIQLQRLLGGTPNELLGLLTEAIHRIPKSGELLTELAKLLIDVGSWTEAKNALLLSLTFTPQYWDSLQELLRLEFLEKGASHATLQNFVSFCRAAGYEPNYGYSFLFIKAHSKDCSVESMVETAAAFMMRLSPQCRNLDICTFISHVDYQGMTASERAKCLFD